MNVKFLRKEIKKDVKKKLNVLRTHYWNIVAGKAKWKKCNHTVTLFCTEIRCISERGSKWKNFTLQTLKWRHEINVECFKSIYKTYWIYWHIRKDVCWWSWTWPKMALPGKLLIFNSGHETDAKLRTLWNNWVSYGYTFRGMSKEFIRKIRICSHDLNMGWISWDIFVQRKRDNTTSKS